MIGILDIFKRKQSSFSNSQSIKLINDNQVNFVSMDSDNAYEVDIVRSCIDVIARNCAKLKIKKIGNSTTVNQLLLEYPNSIVTSYDMIYKLVTQLYMKNNAFLYIKRVGGKVVEITNVDYTTVKISNDLKYLYFTYLDGSTGVASYGDVVHLRRHYNQQSIYGNQALTPLTDALEVLNTASQGEVNAIRTSTNIVGILKFNQVLRDEDISRAQQKFTKSYLGVSNMGGIGAMDAKTDFIPLNLNGKTSDTEKIKEYKNKVLNYFGVSEAILNSSYNEEQYNAFYSNIIEPIAIQLSLELSRKIFSSKELSFNNKITLSADRLMFANNATKTNMIKELMPLGVLTLNDALTILELQTLDDEELGNRRLQSLNFVDMNKVNEYQLESEVTNDEGN